jgi:hypothetical protein
MGPLNAIVSIFRLNRGHADPSCREFDMLWLWEKQQKQGEQMESIC